MAARSFGSVVALAMVLEPMADHGLIVAMDQHGCTQFKMSLRTDLAMKMQNAEGRCDHPEWNSYAAMSVASSNTQVGRERHRKSRNDFLTVAQVAKRYSLSAHSIWSGKRDGKLPASVRVGAD